MTKTTQEILAEATVYADARVRAMRTMETDQEKNSNGSEAWQAVRINTKNLRKLQNELKKLNIQHDSYWGYLIHAPMSNYYEEEAWIEEYVRVLNENGLKANRVERLL
jgi:hypothetical protein